MRVIGAILLMATAVVPPSEVEANGCRARFRTVPSWKPSYQDGAGLILSSSALAATLQVECSMLPKVLNDQEFAAHIGEEEPSEAPPFRRFGRFKGRRWIGPDANKTEWWLMRDRYLIHLILTMEHQPVQEPVAAKVEAMIHSLVVEKP